MSDQQKETEYIDKLFLELSQFSQAWTKREIEMANLLEDIDAAGVPHSAACECEQCEAWSKVNKFCKNIPKWIIK